MSEQTTRWIRTQIKLAADADAASIPNACGRLVDAAATLRDNAVGSVFGLTVRGSEVQEHAALADECLSALAQLRQHISEPMRTLVDQRLRARGLAQPLAHTPWGTVTVTLNAALQDYELSEPVTDPTAWARWDGAPEGSGHLLADLLPHDWLLTSACHLRVTDHLHAEMTFTVTREPTEDELTLLRTQVDALLFTGWGLNTEFTPQTEDDDLTHAALLKASTGVSKHRAA